MSLFKFYLNAVAVEEPRGFADLELSLIRDEKYHGIGQEASVSALEFFGSGGNYLRDAWNDDGILAKVVFRADQYCDDSESTEPETLYEGRINFGTYEENCGTSCSVSVHVEEVSCLNLIRTRFDQKIPLSDPLCVDRITSLTNYAALGIEIILPPVGFIAQDHSEGNADPITVDFDDDPAFVDNVGGGGFFGWVSPAFPVLKWSSLGEYNASVFPVLYGDGFNNRPPSNIMPATIEFPESTVPCGFTDMVASYRLAGSVVKNTSSGANRSELIVKMFKIEEGLDETDAANWVPLYSTSLVIALGSGTFSFDKTASVSISLNQNEKFYFGLFMISDTLTEISVFEFNQVAGATLNFLDITASAKCEETTTRANLIHETLARTIESITNNCASIRSTLYGRTNSQPIAYPSTGCGGLRAVMSGLDIRNAENAEAYTSAKLLIDGLNAIDNIGFGFVPGIGGTGLLEIEDVSFFYQDSPGVSLPFIPRAKINVVEALYYSRILIGYKKWEIQKINGLDEPNSNREYTTPIETVKNIIELLSDFVTGSYPFEITRQQSFVLTGAADTSYDNDLFLLCLRADPGPTDYVVELGEDILSTSANLFSPDTKYNLRITPLRNLFRWLRSVYLTENPSAIDLIYSAGTGNVNAQTKLIDDACVPEKAILTTVSENGDYAAANVKDFFAQKPWENQTVTFDYPLTTHQYRIIKSSPYKYISYQCGTGLFAQGFVKEIRYRPVKGMATIVLIKKGLEV